MVYSCLMGLSLFLYAIAALGDVARSMSCLLLERGRPPVGEARKTGNIKTDDIRSYPEHKFCASYLYYVVSFL
eukprot:TRINITY_DN15390_c0_g1_i1.p1 TRINITY_DN15390_c0_g1~~TRINITY_DN15390_c0_g1_i1.p1  ORF type:complete len:73 (-),score=2.56 TRINITY_DN15390_c0_g1_i1:250-468(-)